MKKILLTGFNPVKGIGDNVNPSYEVVKNFGESFLDSQILKLEVPTEFIQSREIIINAIKEYRPDIVLSIGLSASRLNITLERVAINIRDGDMKDNAGYAPRDEKIFEDGQDGYFSNLPIRKIVEQSKKMKIPMDISNTAGTYCCNQVMYTALYYSNNYYPNMKCGFLHIPYFPEQVVYKSNTPSLPFYISKKAVETCLETTLHICFNS